MGLRRLSVLLLAAALAVCTGCGTAPAAAPATAGSAARQEAPVSEPTQSGEEKLPEVAKAPESEEPESGQPEPETDTAGPIDSVEVAAMEEAPDERPAVEVVDEDSRAGAAAGAKALYPDVVGWLYVRDTGIDDPIVQGDDNQYYLRRAPDGQADMDGSYFADWRCAFGGSPDGLSHNTVLYGHSVSDDADGTLFSRLKHYRDADFAAAHPYIIFSTPDADMAWEVCAVLVADIDIPYNIPDPEAEVAAGLREWMLAESIHDFGVPLRPDDRLLTLSMPDYSVEPSYPNNYRFVVVARLAS